MYIKCSRLCQHPGGENWHRAFFSTGLKSSWRIVWASLNVKPESSRSRWELGLWRNSCSSQPAAWLLIYHPHIGVGHITFHCLWECCHLRNLNVDRAPWKEQEKNHPFKVDKKPEIERSITRNGIHPKWNRASGGDKQWNEEKHRRFLELKRNNSQLYNSEFKWRRIWFLLKPELLFWRSCLCTIPKHRGKYRLKV